VELQSRIEDIRKQGLGLAVISYDSQEVLSAFTKQRGITFTMLSDPGSATIQRFGILNPVPEWAIGPNASDPAVQAEVQKYVSVVRPNERMVGIAFPGTFILDRQGRVTSRFFEDFYIERNTVSSIMMRLGDRKGTVAGTKISTAHFELTTYPSDPTVAPGNRVALALDVKPGPRMHVYAPGAANYRVISLKVDSPPFVRALPMKYPASEIYHFKPLNERVPVFQKPFTLVQEVVVEGTPQAQTAFRGKDSLTLTGTLEYQACDDKICYNPASIPVSWTLKFRPLVVERPVPPKP
jgi:peroxiredoxin